jgi:hypothetical protein
MKSLLSAVRTYVRLIADNPDDNCFGLLVGVTESWIHNMSEIFPKISAGHHLPALISSYLAGKKRFLLSKLNAITCLTITSKWSIAMMEIF